MAAQTVVVTYHNADPTVSGGLFAQLSKPVHDSTAGQTWDARVRVATLVGGAAALSLVDPTDPNLVESDAIWFVWQVVNGSQSPQLGYIPVHANGAQQAIEGMAVVSEPTGSDVPASSTPLELFMARVWDATVSYSQGRIVLGSDDNIYQSLGSGNVGNNPVGGPGGHWGAYSGTCFVLTNAGGGPILNGGTGGGGGGAGTVTAVNGVGPIAGDVTLSASDVGAASSTDVRFAEINGVTVSGTPPTAGQVPTATSGTAAAWATPSGATIHALGTSGGVLSSTDAASVAALLDVTTTSPTIISGSNNLDLSTGRNFEVTAPAGNSSCAFSFTNLPASRSTSFTVEFVQDGTTGGSVATFTVTAWIGAQPSTNTAASAVTFFNFISDGTNIYGVGTSEGISAADALIFGNGNDGAVALTSSSSAGANFTSAGGGFFEAFRDGRWGDGSSIAAGATLRSNCYLLACDGQLTINGTVSPGVITNDVAHTYQGRQTAAAGTTGTLAATGLQANTLYLGGKGGGVSGVASTALPTLPAALASAAAMQDPWPFVKGFIDLAILMTFGVSGVGRGWLAGGTAGNTGPGDGTNAGGAGGNAGGFQVIAARKLVIGSGAAFSVSGGNGANGAAGTAKGGGGGGGGTLVFVCGPESTCNGTALTTASQITALSGVSVAAGTAGTDSPSGTTASAGVAGQVILVVTT